jgi:hypothetical protein
LPAAKRTRTSPASRTIRLLRIDGRERLGLQIRDTRAALLDMVPQPPTPIDVALAERLAVLAAHLSVFDQRALADGGLQPTDAKLYLSLGGQHARLLKQLGARRTERPKGPSLAELFANEKGTAP